jgi:hypothetical protein|eukprot:470309-Prymnesium_polylepis.1
MGTPPGVVLVQTRRVSTGTACGARARVRRAAAGAPGHLQHSAASQTASEHGRADVVSRLKHATSRPSIYALRHVTRPRLLYPAGGLHRHQSRRASDGAQAPEARPPQGR